jgi:hypothetical protein
MHIFIVRVGHPIRTNEIGSERNIPKLDIIGYNSLMVHARSVPDGQPQDISQSITRKMREIGRPWDVRNLR